jgi:hypothetical protein
VRLVDDPPATSRSWCWTANEGRVQLGMKCKLRVAGGESGSVQLGTRRERFTRSFRRCDRNGSCSLHRGLDGTKVTMYAQWRSVEDYEAMRRDPAPLEPARARDCLLWVEGNHSSICVTPPLGLPGPAAACCLFRRLRPLDAANVLQKRPRFSCFNTSK